MQILFPFGPLHMLKSFFIYVYIVSKTFCSGAEISILFVIIRYYNIILLALKQCYRTIIYVFFMQYVLP